MPRTLLLVGVVVAAAAALGLITRNAFSVAFWPANAILVGMMLRAPWLAHPAGWTGAAAGFVLVDRLGGQTPVLSGWFAAANVGGSLVAFLVLRRFDPRDMCLRRVHSMLRILARLLPACLAGGLCGAMLVTV